MGCGTAQGDKGPGEGGENIESSKGTEERGDKEDTGEKTEDADNGKVMGRYLEHSNEALKGQLDTGSRIACMDDGKLAIMSGNAGKWVSADGGATWEKEKMPWHEEMRADDVWIMNAAMSGDGYIAVIYAGGGSEEGGEEDSEYSFHPKYGIAAPDGTFTQIEIPYKDMEYVHALSFAEDGRLFGAALGGKVYEIDRETGDYDDEFLQWVFKRKDIPTEDLPENTSLQRRMKEYLLRGGKVADAEGVWKRTRSQRNRIRLPSR